MYKKTVGVGLGLRESEEKGRADLELAFQRHEEALEKCDGQGEEDEFGDDVHCRYEFPSLELDVCELRVVRMRFPKNMAHQVAALAS
jgi:hypothetical protein